MGTGIAVAGPHVVIDQDAQGGRGGERRVAQQQPGEGEGDVERRWGRDGAGPVEHGGAGAVGEQVEGVEVAVADDRTPLAGLAGDEAVQRVVEVYAPGGRRPRLAGGATARRP